MDRRVAAKAAQHRKTPYHLKEFLVPFMSFLLSAVFHQESILLLPAQTLFQRPHQVLMSSRIFLGSISVPI